MQKYNLNSTSQPADLQVDYKKELNQEQYRVVTEADGACLVLAGAGSGKTRTLVYRVAYLLEKGIRPDRILLVTFTNKAAKEMLNRIEVVLNISSNGLWGGTFHHIGNRLLRKYGRHIGIDPNFVILDADDAKTIVKSAMSMINLPTDKLFPKADLIYKMISLSENLMTPIKEVVRSRFSQIPEEYLDLIEQIKISYQQKKEKSNSLDFDDLLSKWNLLLLESKEVRDKLSTQFQYIMVDEYQDTNSLQGQIVAHLAAKNKNILVVGDDSQSIYSFRGADVNNILNFPKTFENVKTFRLETNYRSTPEILRLANESIEFNQNKFAKHLQTNKDSGVKPALVPLSDSGQQAEFICQRIVELERDKEIPLDGIAVLFRAHYQSLELELELNKRNIPYIMRGGMKFFEQAHIKDVVAYLKIMANFHDEVSWRRILMLQPGIGQATADKIWQTILNLPDLRGFLVHGWEEVSAKAFSSLAEVKSVLGLLAEKDKNNVAELIDFILRSGYREFVKNSYENFQDRIDDLEQLAVFAGNYDSLDGFLADSALGETFRGEGAEPEEIEGEKAVILSTIHQAKGLEWPAVFVIGLVDGQFPGTKSLDSVSAIEEERRLFYVATTRAQDYLYLTYPEITRFSENFGSVSRFVDELPKDVFEDWQVSEQSSDEVVYVDEEDDSVAQNFWNRVIANRQKKP